MTAFALKAALAVLLSFAWSGPQDVDASVDHLNAPQLLFSSKAPAVGDGNAVEISPDGKVVYVTSMDGTLSGFDPVNGTTLFSYRPPQLSGRTIACKSGVSFFLGVANLQSYVVYTVVDESNGIEDSTSRVIAVSHPSGQELWISIALDGVASGTPKISTGGQHVFLNHNTDKLSSGVFTILLATAGGSQLFSAKNTTNPYAPLGIFHRPTEGYYLGGENNFNDILVWSFAPRPNATSVGEGSTFAFQFPPFYQGGSAGLSVTILNSVLGWKSVSAPVLGRNGYSLYFGVSRNQFRAWVGERGDLRSRFHRGANYEQNDLERARPGDLAPFNTPTLNSDGTKVFSGLANSFMASFHQDLELAWIVPLTGRGTVVKSEAVVSTDDEIVYYAESSGLLHAALASDGTKIWELALGAPVLSDFSLSPDGFSLFIGDTNGTVTAWTVADPPPQCNICEDGSLPSFPNARLNLPGLGGDNCSVVMQMGIEGKISARNCLTVQLMAKNPCGCGFTLAPTSVNATVAPTAAPTPLPSSSVVPPVPTGTPSAAPTPPTTPVVSQATSSAVRLGPASFFVLPSLAFTALSYIF